MIAKKNTLSIDWLIGAHAILLLNSLNLTPCMIYFHMQESNLARTEPRIGPLAISIDRLFWREDSFIKTI